MLLHKTPWNRRGAYTYEYFDDDDVRRVVLRPGENGVTEEDIKRLHAMDDSEVYYNLKAVSPEATLSRLEKRALRTKKDTWAEGYIAGFQAQYGYEPHPKDVADALRNAFPKIRVASLEFLTEGEDEDESLRDKSTALSASCESNTGEMTVAERMEEIVGTLSENERTVYKRAMLGGETQSSVGQDLGISKQRVGQIEKKISAIFAADEILQSFFR